MTQERHGTPRQRSLLDAWNRLQELVQNEYQGCTNLSHALNEVAGAIAAEIILRTPQSETAATVVPDVLAQVEAALRKNDLIGRFLDQGFWHAHHVDIVIRQDGQDRRFEADWIKDLWYIVRRRGLTATQAVRADQTAGCTHAWPGPGPMPASYYCVCGTKVYRSREDAIDD